MDKLQQAAQYAIQLLKGKEENWIAIAAQFVLEKGYYFWESPSFPYNVGNVRFVNGEFKQFETLDEGIEGYVNFLTHDPAGYYTKVLEEIRTGSPDGVLEALAKSPYCAPEYNVKELLAIMGHLEVVYKLFVPKPKQSPVEPLKEEKAETTPPETKEEPKEKFVTVTAHGLHNTLWGIAQDEYGNGRDWKELLRLNPGIHPAYLKVGQEIRVR